MTTTLSVKGQLVIPQSVRDRHRLKPGTDFTILTRSSGEIVLRPVKQRRRYATLAENLSALSGLNVKPEATIHPWHFRE
jgi:AbrB family looped-hinge helix DNA binding protein